MNVTVNLNSLEIEQTQTDTCHISHMYTRCSGTVIANGRGVYLSILIAFNATHLNCNLYNGQYHGLFGKRRQ